MSESTLTRLSVAERLPPLLPERAATRLGLVALSTDMTIEGDARALLPTDAALHVSRIRFANPTTPGNLLAMGPRLGAAADLLVPGQPLAAIGFGCTSASSLIGDETVAEAIGAVRPGVPVMTPTRAARQALEALGIRRIALLTPYLPETTAPMIAYFAAAGLEVVQAHCLGFADDRDMARVVPEAILAAAETADHPQAGALFLSCTALPALPLVDALEARLGKPVLCSNQALFWAMLSLAGLPMPRGFGRIFAAPMRAA